MTHPPQEPSGQPNDGSPGPQNPYYGPPGGQPGNQSSPEDTQAMPPYYPPPGPGGPAGPGGYGPYGGPGPTPPPGGGPPPPGSRKAVFIVLGIVAVLLLVAGGLAVFAFDSDSSEAEGNGDVGGGPTAVLPTEDLPTDALPTDAIPTDDLPSGLPTDITDLPEMPTEGGPSEEEYVEIATGFAEAIRDDDCDKARTFMSDTYNASITDEDLCENEFNGPGLDDDDLSEYELETFGTFGAAVTFDDGNTYIGLSVQDSGEPLVDMFFTF